MKTPLPTSTPKFKFDLQETVYHVMALEKEPGMVVGRIERLGGEPLYEIVWCDREQNIHLGEELSDHYTAHYRSDE